jgi:monovalent cation:proton antiporter-2 (CPA2) family protein
MEYSVTVLALLAAAVLLVPVFKRLRLGTVIGYLAAGIVVGPYGFGVVGDPQAMLHVAELGVILLLFLVGLELQPAKLLALKREVFGLGAMQVAGCALVFGLAAWALGVPPQGAWLVGAAIAMSSTAFILPMLAETKQLAARHGREAIAVAIFQDLAIIPIMLLLGLLAASGNAAQQGGHTPGWPALALLALLVLGGRPAMGLVFRYTARFGSRELFTAAALLVTVGIALAMERVGLSASLGAFAAGVLLADSEFRHELEASIAPFESLLLGLFFMGVGMGVNLGLLASAPLAALGLALAIIAGKALVVFALRRHLAPLLLRQGCEVDNALALALTLAVGGEFAFVMLAAARQGGLIEPRVEQLVTLGVVLSMMLAPLVLLGFERWRAARKKAAPRDYDTIDADDAAPVVIAGFGRVGQIVGRMLNARKVPFTALDKSSEHVDFVRRFGNRIYYGDAAKLELLHAAKVEQARLFVLAVDDIDESLLIAELVRRHFPGVPILARARNRNHLMRLRDLGVTQVMRETFLSSVEMGRLALLAVGAAPADLQRFVALFVQQDEALLERQQAVYKDPQALAATSKTSREELQAILEQSLEEQPVEDEAARRALVQGTEAEHRGPR